MDAPTDAFFQRLAFVCTEVRRAFDRASGMSQARRQLLSAVADTGEISHAALQQLLALDGATVTRLVKEFEAEGVLSRRLAPQDNRYTLVALTAAGQAQVATLDEAHHLFQARLLAGITREQQDTVTRVLERVRANIRTIQETKVK